MQFGGGKADGVLGAAGVPEVGLVEEGAGAAEAVVEEGVVGVAGEGGGGDVVGAAWEC